MKFRKFVNFKIIIRLALYITLICLPLYGSSQDLFKTKLIDINSGLSQNTITALESDCLGRVWIGTPNSIHYYNGYNLTTLDSSYNRVLNFYPKDSLIFCLTIDELIKINVYNFSQKVIQLPKRDFYYNEIKSNGILLINADKSDTLFYDFNLEPIPKELWNIRHNNLHITKFQLEHSIISYGTNGLIYSNKNGIDSILTSSYCSDGAMLNNTLYIASQDGVIELSEVNGQIKSNVLFPNQNIGQLLVDDNNNLWIGTVSNGLFLIHYNTLKGDYFEIKGANNSPIACWMIFEHQNQIYTCSTEGIKALQINNELNSIEKLTEGIGIFSAVSGGDFLLLGTKNQGILKIEKNKLSQVYKNDTNSLSNMIVYIIINEQGFLASSKTSIIQLDKTGEVMYEKPMTGEGRPYLMHIKKRDKDYIASSTYGIEIRDSNLNLVKQHTNADARVFCMTSQYKEENWTVSLDAGLFKLANDSLIPIPFPDHHLLTIQSLDSNQRLFWIPSSTSAYLYNDEGIIEYNRQNGFPIAEYSQNGIYLDTRNTLYTAGIGGVFAFNRQELTVPGYLPQVLITHGNNPISDGDQILVDFDVSKLSFNIEPIIMTDQNLFTVEYQLNKSPWIPVNGPKNIEMDLSYGRTALNVRTLNLTNNLTELKTIIIVRSLPFWKKTWFIITAILLGIILLIGIYSLVRFIQTKRKIKRLLVERKVEQERLRISSELHDNIGARLTHIISSLDIEMYKQNEETGISSINQFARETMSQLRETIWAVSNQSIFFSVFLKRVEQYITQVDGLAKPNLTFENQIRSDYEMSPTALINYYRIIQEAINNAVKYANAKSIKVVAIEKNGLATITITDDGLGIDLDAPLLGSGIQGMKNRAKEVDAIIKIESKKQKGSTITLEFKID